MKVKTSKFTYFDPRFLERHPIIYVTWLPPLPATAGSEGFTSTYIYYKCGYKFYTASPISNSVRTIGLFPTILLRTILTHIAWKAI